MHARTLVLSGLALLSLAGCQKPTPGVTVAAGTHSTHLEATTYCRDGQSAAAANCVEHLDRLGVLTVKPGQAVSIDVDGALADHGWILVDADAKARSQVQDTHYFSYTPSFANGSVIHLEIRSLDRVANDATVTGVWKFQLVES